MARNITGDYMARHPTMAGEIPNRGRLLAAALIGLCVQVLGGAEFRLPLGSDSTSGLTRRTLQMAVGADDADLRPDSVTVMHRSSLGNYAIQQKPAAAPGS